MFKHQTFKHLTIPKFFFITLFLLITVIPTTNAQQGTPFRIYLTFEDGPTDAYTPQILDTLAQYNAKATFLIADYQITGHEELIQREVREGHAIINHLWDEPGVYAGAPDQAVIDSYLRTEEAIRAALGAELPRYDSQVKMFWQPGGAAKPLPEIEGVHVITYNWSVNSDDCGWKLHVDLDTIAFDKGVIDNVLNKPQSEGQLYNVYDFGDGAIVAFHDINRVTGRVLPTILSELQQAGATFEALPRPWDQLDTMPVVLGVPPGDSDGIIGITLPARILEHARVRATPGLDGQILETLAPDILITATGRANGWIQVTYDGKSGWIFRDLLKIIGPIPSLPRIST